MTRPQVMLIYVLLLITEDFAESIKPRRSIFFKDMNLKQFGESDFGLSSLVVRDDICQLVLGVRGKVLTLSLDDITQKTSEVKWTVSPADKTLCRMKGKSPEECDNFIRVLHTMNDGRMLVCGTNAFNPACDHMTFINGSISLERRVEEGRGKVPFDPNQRFASLMDGNTLYSAVSSNFLGSEMVFQRHGLDPVKTEMKRSWLNEPTMISITVAEASRDKQDGEDDHVFLFFTEGAVEERRANILVSRIARVCKSDLGGRRTLQKRWTSFLKARLDCPFGDVGSPALVQDVFLFRDQNDLSNSIFYAAFTSNPEPSSLCSQSAVCAYKLSDISQVFKGKFLTESNTGSWDTHTGEEPFPYPGSCINNEMQEKGVMTSLNLSDTTLLFVKNHPLMEGVVTPITGKPLLVQTPTRFSRIVVDQVTSADGQKHQIIWIGTDSGWLQKAVKFDGEEGRIIEELQLFKSPQPVEFLQLSSKTVRLSSAEPFSRFLVSGVSNCSPGGLGQLYSASKNGAVQVDVRDCSRYTLCDDCLLARDPYCGWDQIRGQCASVAITARSLIQSLSDGDIKMCSTDSEKEPAIVHLTIDIAQFLPCSPDANLPISWRFLDDLVHPGPRHILLSQGLIIRPSSGDAGLYTCETVEAVKGRVHRKVVIQYLVKVQDPSSVVSKLKAVVLGVAALAGLLAFVIIRQVKGIKVSHVGCGIQSSDK